jgi:hypothetical protein
VSLSHFASSGGALLASGTETVDAGSTDLESEYIGDALRIDMGEAVARQQNDVILTRHQGGNEINMFVKLFSPEVKGRNCKLF